MSTATSESKPHVVIVGGGFGGLNTARALANDNVRVTVIDRHNHHLFQPLLYQVASANMMAEEIAMPIRRVLRRQKNAQVLLGEVSRVDTQRKSLYLSDHTEVAYDYLVLAAGAKTNYFGNDAWSEHTLGLKSVDDAYAIRRRVLTAFEQAEREPSAELRRRLLTFVVIGGGPTGVELAGALSELGGAILQRDFRRVTRQDMHVTLLEAAPRLLLAFHPKLGQNAQQELGKLGVDVRVGAQVLDIDSQGVSLKDGHLAATLVVWAAGVTPQNLAKNVLGLEATNRGYIPVEQDCSIKGHPEVFAIGDMAAFVPDAERKKDTAQPRPLPGIAPVAMQQGNHVAKLIRGDLKKKPRKSFVYKDKGNMATIGRSRAVLEVGKLRMTGLLAWLAWIAVHIFYLIGFRNRAFVMFEWGLSYISNHRGARLISEAVDSQPAVLSRSVEGTPKDHPQEIGEKSGWNQNTRPAKVEA